MKSQNFLITIGFTLSAAFVTSCAPVSSGSHTVISGAAILSTSAAPDSKAEQLAKGSESLFEAEAFQQAADMADLALTQDPENFRALFLKAALEPMLLQKGMVTRMAPLAATDPFIANLLNVKVNEINGLPSSYAVGPYLLDGNQDIVSEDQLQVQTDKTINALDHLRLFLNANKDQELTLKVPPIMAQDFNQRYSDACQVQINAKFEYELTCPPAYTRRTISLNRADFEQLHDGVTYYLMQALAINSFDLTNVFLVDGQINHGDSPAMAQQWYDNLLKEARFGKLRNAKNLIRLRSLGLELITGIQWAIDNQASVCPNPNSSKGSRPGMLMNDGLCLPASYLAKPVADIKSTLGGLPTAVTLENDSSTYQTKIYWTALLDHPVADIRQLGPMTFDPTSRLTGIGDKTGGGMLAGGDANYVLSLKNVGVKFP